MCASPREWYWGWQWAADGAAQKPASVDPDVTACQKVTAAEMEQFIGAPATIRETGANLCSWQGGKPNAYAQVMYFAGESHGLPVGQERSDDRGAEGAGRAGGDRPGARGSGDIAWGPKLAQNETDYFAVYLFKGKDNVTITTNGIGYDATVEIAPGRSAYVEQEQPIGCVMRENSTSWIRNTIIPTIATGMIIYASSSFYRGTWGEPSIMAISIIGGVSAFVCYFLYERIRK